MKYCVLTVANLGEVSEGRRGYNNLPHLKTFRKTLRNNATPAEAKLWTMLKGKQMEGRKFRRQHSFANYILDFFCPEEGLAIELDGQGHFDATQAEYDRERDWFLETFGIRVLRFENKWVWDNPDGLLREVISYFGKQPPQPPRPADTPPCKGGELGVVQTSKPILLVQNTNKVGSQKIMETPKQPNTYQQHTTQSSSHNLEVSEGRRGRDLQTLPNIDINIKCGNSLVSKFKLDDSYNRFRPVDKQNLRRIMPDYKKQTDLYKCTNDKKARQFIQKELDKYKNMFKNMYNPEDACYEAYIKARNEWLVAQTDLYGNDPVVLKEKETVFKQAEAAWQTKMAIYDHAFEWRFEFPEVLNDDGDFVGFDVVIGNPPYIKEYEGKKIFDGLRTNEVYQGKMDIWYMFGSHGINLLKRSGYLSLIAQNNWTTNTGATKFRNFILQNAIIKELIDFGSYLVFDAASIQTMIMFFKKQKESEYSLSYKKIITSKPELKDALNLINGIRNNSNEFITTQIKIENYIDENLTFSSSKVDLILNKMMKKSDFQLDEKEVANGIHPHHDFVNSKLAESLNNVFKVGDGIFALSEAEKTNLKLSHEELTLIKPYYKSEQFFRYFAIPKNEYWLIYTTSKFKNPNEILPYPNIKKHLDKFQAVITSDNKPYGLHRTRVEDFFIGEKIIVQRKCPNKPVFTYTDFNSYVSATFYVIKTSRLNQKFLTGLLNSRLIEFWLKHKGKMQGNNYQIDKAPLLELPLISPIKERQNEIAVLVSKIIKINQKSS